MSNKAILERRAKNVLREKADRVSVPKTLLDRNNLLHGDDEDAPGFGVRPTQAPYNSLEDVGNCSGRMVAARSSDYNALKADLDSSKRITMKLPDKLRTSRKCVRQLEPKSKKLLIDAQLGNIRRSPATSITGWCCAGGKLKKGPERCF